MDLEDETSKTYNESSSEFIDDYSHLRLSYYQLRGRNNSLSFNQSDTQDNSKLDSTSKDATDSDVTQDIEIAERQRLREYYISQIPDLPHPSYTMASIIATQSRRSGGNFVYNDRIQQGNKYEQQGNRYVQQGNRYEQQGNRYEQQRNRYEQQGNRYEQQGNRYVQQGNRYEQQGNRYEHQGNRNADVDDVLEFSPQKRSTLLPNQLKKRGNY